jgi:hypothetical protein
VGKTGKASRYPHQFPRRPALQKRSGPLAFGIAAKGTSSLKAPNSKFKAQNNSQAQKLKIISWDQFLVFDLSIIVANIFTNSSDS